MLPWRKVYSVSARRTEFAEEGKLLMQLADLRHERCGPISTSREIGRLAVGQNIQIKWDAKPGRVWTGTLSAACDGNHLWHTQRGRGCW